VGPFLAVGSSGTVHVSWSDETDGLCGSDSDTDVFYSRGGGLSYNSFGPGLISSRGLGWIDGATGEYCFNLGRIRFIGISALGGGPSFFHSPPLLGWTEGNKYDATNFVEFCWRIGPCAIFFGWSFGSGTITGNSYP